MIQMLALSTVLRCSVFSVYPEANPGLRPIFHWKISPRIIEDHSNALEQVQNMWSRDGNLDTRPSASFQPVPVLAREHTKEDLPAKKLTGERDIPSFFQPANVNTSPMVDKATKLKVQDQKKIESEAPTSKKKTSRKFLPHWKDDFPLIVYDD